VSWLLTTAYPHPSPSPALRPGSGREPANGKGRGNLQGKQNIFVLRAARGQRQPPLVAAQVLDDDIQRSAAAPRRPVGPLDHRDRAVAPRGAPGRRPRTPPRPRDVGVEVPQGERRRRRRAPGRRWGWHRALRDPSARARPGRRRSSPRRADRERDHLAAGEQPAQPLASASVSADSATRR